ncbi:hypothetical protein [Oryzobacter telluris]|uniref:hypothetical protein n=1 Tax=Oryzobacter telluris TaxID=3149179 RepID=UPI00370DD114
MVSVLWWALVGALGAFSVAALLTIGVFVLPVVLVLGAIGLWSARLRPGILPGLLLGGSLVPLWLAFLNRSGPGRVCETTATSSSCGEQYSPWPFVVVALLMAGAGLWLVRRGTAGVDPAVPVTPTPAAGP